MIYFNLLIHYCIPSKTYCFVEDNCSITYTTTVLYSLLSRLMTDLKQVGTKRTNSVRLVFWQEIMNNDVQVRLGILNHCLLGMFL